MHCSAKCELTLSCVPNWWEFGPQLARFRLLYYWSFSRFSWSNSIHCLARLKYQFRTGVVHKGDNLCGAVEAQIIQCFTAWCSILFGVSFEPDNLWLEEMTFRHVVENDAWVKKRLGIIGLFNPLLAAETCTRQMFSTALVLTDVIVGPRGWDYWCINTAVAILVSDLQSSVWCCRFIVIYLGVSFVK